MANRIPTATAAGKSGKAHRKMRNYMLDKQLQLRYILFVTTLSALIAGSLGFLIYKQEADASEKILETLDTSSLADDPELAEAIDERLSSYDSNLVLTMIAVGVGLVLVLSAYLLIMTHKVAGPLYKVSKYFDEMAEGRLGDVYELRKGDMLVSFYDKFHHCHDVLRERHLATNDLLSRFLEACKSAGVERKGEVGAALDDAQKFVDRRTEALS